MKKNLLLCHVGLGDAFICNGLVRTLGERYGNLIVPSIPDYYETVKFMYSDLDSIEVLKLPEWDKFVDDLELRRRHFENLLNLTDYNVTALGFLNETEGLWDGMRSIDRGFYAQAKVPFSYKWSKCWFPRSDNQIPVPEGDYVFVHMDKTRRLEFGNTSPVRLYIIQITIQTTYLTGRM